MYVYFHIFFKMQTNLVFRFLFFLSWNTFHILEGTVELWRTCLPRVGLKFWVMCLVMCVSVSGLWKCVFLRCFHLLHVISKCYFFMMMSKCWLRRFWEDQMQRKLKVLFDNITKCLLWWKYLNYADVSVGFCLFFIYTSYCHKMSDKVWMCICMCNCNSYVTICFKMMAIWIVWNAINFQFIYNDAGQSIP